ncbi:hypothetical protein ONS95_004433 [Cadophora gregata]|uniref:uncharacterized protein n=1 Tax=Cadophora gregata TaxID=51156 RepID=UPI0026DBAC19|nr:uncharacterized protein ONS95_004433 [Cadophora gregata]KAK0105169.1 hypothetical protein ONS96_004570 [Cadophora gregata f. sp. sojae]KAK0105920.1 hypothetical protein ONS95_004433 [Cadophora gregata]
MSDLLPKEEDESPMSDIPVSDKMDIDDGHEKAPRICVSQSSRPCQTSFVKSPEWRRFDENNLRRVLTKEKAVEDGEEALKALVVAMKAHLFLNPSCQPRINRIDTVLGRKKTFQILVGFLGITGAGKTTLINALVGYRNLLPSSAERACTAVVVEIAYNSSNDKDALFQSEIVYITRDEWRDELERFYEDLEAPAATDDDQESDTERRERIKETLDKLKCVYPRVKSVEQLRSSSVEQLLQDPAVCNLLGRVVKVKSGTKVQFSNTIKNHIDSGDNDGTAAQWPLVKLVRVFVKSDFLKHGITLVDLPGNLDNNAARSAVAEHYQKELSVTCILAEAKRGISEKNAHDLLEKVTKRNLQLDGLYNAESLCFVLSQTDRDFDIMEYLKGHPVLKAACADDHRKVLDLVVSLKARLEEDRVAKANDLENRKRVKQFSIKSKKLKAQLGITDIASPSSGRNWKRSAEDTDSVFETTQATDEQMALRNELSEVQKLLDDARKTYHQGADELSSLGRRVAHLRTALFHARSHIRVACIQNRNKVATAAIRRDYNDTLAEMGRESSGPLEVFCVAATVHLQYLKMEPSMTHPGFPQRQDTQIGRLRDWLVSTTFPTRESYAQAFLEDTEATLDSMMPWIKDKYADYKMPSFIREQWEPQMDRDLEELQNQFSQLKLSAIGDFKQLIRTGIYSKVPAAEKVALAKVKDVVESWATGMHWSTHRTVNRNHGIWKDSRKRNHKWNALLVHELTTPLVASWDKTFTRGLPTGRDTYVAEGQRVIANFADKVSDANFCPDVADGLVVLKDQIMRSQALLKNQTTTTFEAVTKAVRKAHKTATPAVKQFLIPTYDKCAAEGGSGHYARNKALLKNTMKNKGLQMYQKGSGAVRSALDDMLESLSPSFDGNHKAVLDQIREDIQLFFEQNSANGIRSSFRRVESPSKVKLQKDLLIIVDKLAEAWKSEVSIRSRQEVDDDDDEETTFDDAEFFNIDDNDDQDEDYEYKSDQD